MERIFTFAQLVSISPVAYGADGCRWEPAENTRLCPNTLDDFWSVAALPPVGTELKKGRVIKRTDGLLGAPLAGSSQGRIQPLVYDAEVSHSFSSISSLILTRSKSVRIFPWCGMLYQLDNFGFIRMRWVTRCSTVCSLRLVAFVSTFANLNSNRWYASPSQKRVWTEERFSNALKRTTKR